MTKSTTSTAALISPRLAFILVSFCLGNLGDGLNIFQGIYLVGIGWNESSVGAALSLMGLTALLVQPLAGDWVDKATAIPRRLFLVLAAIATALSASTVLKVQPGNRHEDHVLMYSSKIVEGVASSFIGPCLAALTLASFGPTQFDAVMASNLLWGHIGSVVAAVSAGIVAYVSYPDIQYCFLVIGVSALLAVLVVPSLPEGDPMMGRGFQGTATIISNDKEAAYERVMTMSMSSDSSESLRLLSNNSSSDDDTATADNSPLASSYLTVLLDPKTCIVGMTGFFFHFANANVLLILGELMGDNNKDDDKLSRTAIPLTAGAIVLAQFTMAVATYIGNALTGHGMGRKPLFMAALLTLPVRCLCIISLQHAGHNWLLSTQLLDGIGGGLFALIHPYLVADITMGTGRFNVVMGFTASCFGLGATLSNFLGQMVVEHFGHIASLSGSLILSIVPILLFSHMPETLGHRGGERIVAHEEQQQNDDQPQRIVSYQNCTV